MKLLRVQTTAAQTIYFALIDNTGKLFDWADKTPKPLSTAAVNAVTTGGVGAGAFRVGVNVLASLTTGNHIRIRGSVANDGVYTIRAGSAFAAGNTTINVAEAVASLSVTGSVDLNATPFVAGVEHTDPGGAQSYYDALIDLTQVHTSGDLADYSIAAYVQAGAAPVPATDATVLAGPMTTERLRLEFGFEGDGLKDLDYTAAFTATSGVAVDFTAALTRNGLMIPLQTYAPAATLALTCYPYSSTTPLFTIAAVTVDSLGFFNLAYATPGFTAELVYKLKFTLVENGNTWTFAKTLACHG